MTRAILELLRPANVVTAVADVLAGFAVAGLHNRTVLGWLLVSTACLYAGGVVLNDVFDREVDRAERPERPIPSGRVSIRGASVLGALLLAVGVAAATQATAAAGMIAAIIAGLVVLYDAWGKRHGAVAPVNMGLCRAFNLLLGVSAMPAALPDAWPLALIPLLYIAAITALSRGEVHGGTRWIATVALISLSASLLAVLVVTLRAGAYRPPALALAIVLGWRVLPLFWKARTAPTPGVIRGAVRRGVLSLVILDAAIGASYAGPIWAAVILTTGLIAGWLARLFAVT